MYKNYFYAFIILLAISASSCVKIHDCKCHIVDATIPHMVEERDETYEFPGTKSFAETECERKAERLRELYEDASSCKLQ